MIASLQGTVGVVPAQWAVNRKTVKLGTVTLASVASEPLSSASGQLRVSGPTNGKITRIVWEKHQTSVSYGPLVPYAQVTPDAPQTLTGGGTTSSSGSKVVNGAASRRFTVRFTPDNPGQYHDVLLIYHDGDANSTPLRVAVSGQAVQKPIPPKPVAVRAISATMKVTDPTTLTVRMIVNAITPGAREALQNPDVYSFVCAVAETGRSGPVHVSLDAKPTLSGQDTVTFNVSMSGDTFHGDQVVDLYISLMRFPKDKTSSEIIAESSTTAHLNIPGPNGGKALLITPNPADFGQVQQDTTKTLPLTVTGLPNQRITAIRILDGDVKDFQIADSFALPLLLSGAGKAQVRVQFRPTAKGQRMARMQITYQDVKAPGGAKVSSNEPIWRKEGTGKVFLVRQDSASPRQNPVYGQVKERTVYVSLTGVGLP